MNLIAGCFFLFFFEKGKQDWYSLDPTNEKKGREDINEQNQKRPGKYDNRHQRNLE